MLLAALGPKNVALAAELVEVWEPLFFHPGKAQEVWGESLEAGKAKRDAGARGRWSISTAVGFAVGDGAGELLEHVQPTIALYVGGMGAKGKNFYTSWPSATATTTRPTRSRTSTSPGSKEEAAAEVPEELAHAVSLVGSEDEVARAGPGVRRRRASPSSTSCPSSPTTRRRSRSWRR